MLLASDLSHPFSSWDPNQGLFINDKHVKVRGFCDHNDFEGMRRGATGRRLARAPAVALFRRAGTVSLRDCHSQPSRLPYTTTGVGMAVADRINLFRAQSVRGLGGNGWRMSHNPPIPTLLDILDRVGVVVMDENRLFANVTSYVEAMGDLVRRDRKYGRGGL